MYTKQVMCEYDSKVCSSGLKNIETIVCLANTSWLVSVPYLKSVPLNPMLVVERRIRWTPFPTLFVPIGPTNSYNTGLNNDIVVQVCKKWTDNSPFLQSARGLPGELRSHHDVLLSMLATLYVSARGVWASWLVIVLVYSGNACRIQVISRTQ
ncbi:hypothetical protein F4678DRAFT_334606 [Xylaria arbuscula]|nr:hypothetical protein F4678DRAFT_334606 [Xylaria arbuscula]